MKPIYILFIALLFSTIPTFAEDQPSSNDIMQKMQTTLDLQEDQITNITPIIEKYENTFHDFQKSVDDGTINPSAIDSQRQGIEDEETQDLSQYLKPNQITEWRQMQKEIYEKGNQDSGEGSADADGTSNLPNYKPSQ